MLLVFGLAILALIDCLSSESDEIRALPKVVWVFIILLFPLLGSIVWFLAGRPRRTEPRSAWPAGDGFPEATRPIAPDDDPEFLDRLRRQQRSDDEKLLKQWEEDLRRREDDLRRREGPGDEES